jgi:glycosyltransferase involved in cell wall biosynthesis
LNALATHTPVLVSDVAGMTEFLQPGLNGHAFARGSVDDLADKLKALVAEPQALYALSATTHYERTPALMASETLSIYSGV